MKIGPEQSVQMPMKTVISLIIMVALGTFGFFQIQEKLNDRLNFTVKNIDAEAFVNYFQIVKWPTKELQGEHKDYNYHYYTSIIYLNDNFEGGETVVEKIKIKPKQGLMVLFDGDKKTHSVNEIKKRTRYTLPCWYTK